VRNDSDSEDLPTLWELHHEKLPPEDGVSYYCLSYTWDAADKTCTAIIDECSIAISKNLHEALRQSQEYCKKLKIDQWALWVDALCINQANYVEKNAQVQQMGMIYQNASLVLAWLGSHREHSDWAMERIEELSRNAIECELWEIPIHRWPKIVLDGDKVGRERAGKLGYHLRQLVVEYQTVGHFPLAPFIRLMGRAWWERVWILLEIAVSKAAVIMCGSHAVEWRGFQLAFQMLELLALCLKTERLLGPANREDFAFLQSRICPLVEACNNISRTKHAITTSDPLTLKDLLIQSSINSRMQTTDAKDRIFALLGMAADQYQLKIAVDYSKSVETLYAEVAQAIIMKPYEKGRLNLLSYCMLQPKFEDSILPSWVPDWRRPVPNPLSPVGDSRKKGKYFLDPVQPTNLVCMSDGNDNPILLLEGHQIDTVRLLGDVYPLAEFQPADLEPGQIARVIEWLEQLMDMSHTRLEEYSSNVTRLDAVMRTAIADWEFQELGDNLQRATDRSTEGFRILTGIVEPQGRTPGECQAWVIEKSLPYRLALGWSAPRRRSFVTSKGHIGLGPESLEPGDIVAEIAGSDVPFALRQGENNRYCIVGEVYVHGVMDGEHRHKYFETWSWPKRETFEIY